MCFRSLLLHYSPVVMVYRISMDNPCQQVSKMHQISVSRGCTTTLQLHLPWEERLRFIFQNQLNRDPSPSTTMPPQQACVEGIPIAPTLQIVQMLSKTMISGLRRSKNKPLTLRTSILR